MTRLSGLLDPESAAIVTATFDAVTSPRRGGPRFVDSDLAARAEQIITDERTTEQLVLDAFVELIRIGTAADANVVFGAKRPGVKLLVTDKDLRERRGVGFIEGHTEPVSIATIERHACTTGVVPVIFDSDAEILNLGREQRLFTSRQAIAIAARDGGCQFGDCDRPPSWCETHHIDHWPETTARRTQTAESCSADTTTCSCTTTAGKPPAPTGPPISSPHPTSTPTRDPSAHERKAPHWRDYFQPEILGCEASGPVPPWLRLSSGGGPATDRLRLADYSRSATAGRRSRRTCRTRSAHRCSRR